MTKTIKINNIEISVEEFKRLAKENEALLKEPEVKVRYFFPKVGEAYWHTTYLGNIYRTQHVNDLASNGLISIGNCYRTKEEAELALKKQQAIVRCWKWQQENAPFEPDWRNEHKLKNFAMYDHKDKTLKSDYAYRNQQQFTLPYFKSREDCDAFIEANKEDLLLLFTK